MNSTLLSSEELTVERLEISESAPPTPGPITSARPLQVAIAIIVWFLLCGLFVGLVGEQLEYPGDPTGAPSYVTAS